MHDKAKELIKIALSYFDTNNEKYASLYDKFKYFTIDKSNNDTEHGIIKFYDKDDKLIFQSKYEVLGFYDNSSHLWVWGWAIPMLYKNEVYLSRKILNYGLDLSLNEDKFLKSELITSRFIISDPIQLNIHASIASYISKTPMIFQLIQEKSDIIQETIKQDKKSKLLTHTTPNSISWFYYLIA
jgi:hypothetical protein